MRVLQLGKFYPVQGGVEKVMYDLLSGLTERHVPCDMLCAAVDKEPVVIPVNAYGKVICTRTLLKKYATMVSPQMIGTLRRIAPQYDIIHVHHPDPMAALALRLSGYRGKVVLHWHSDIVKQKKLLRFYQPLQRWLIERADLIVGTTPVYIAASHDLSGVQPKCTYLPIGVVPVAADAEGARRLRARYAGKKIVFSLGRLVHYKGYCHLVDAAKYLDDSYVVLIGGSGDLRGELEAQIQREGLADRVHLLGHVPDEELSAYYGACDVYCLSSIMKTEAFAIVQIEAMSCGKPVVSCNIEGSGVPWVNQDGVSGLVVEPESGRALADAIRRIMGDRALYERLSTGAKSRYQELFTEEKMIDKCLSLYQQLLK